MMKSIFIFGCSGFAVEVAQIIISLGEYDLRGFIEKDCNITSEKSSISINQTIYPIFAESEFKDNVKTANKRYYCVIAIANGKICKKIYENFRSLCNFPNIISPHAKINDARLEGKGNIIFNDCIISWNVKIGSFNKFLPFVTIGHETIIGDYNEFNPKVSISGKIQIGNCNLFG